MNKIYAEILYIIMVLALAGAIGLGTGELIGPLIVVAAGSALRLGGILV